MAQPPKKPLGPSTTAVHGGESRPKLGHALTTPIVQTASYTFANTQELKDHFDGKIDRVEYGRYGNPTQRVAEEKLAALEGAEACLLFASGMAAMTTTLFANDDAVRDALARHPRRRHRRQLPPHAPVPEPDAPQVRHRGVDGPVR
jgi:O-acetylhomoserine/O-acetylserine sulfhydrylase-like pyridoxal-dependent enzyme